MNAFRWSLPWILSAVWLALPLSIQADTDDFVAVAGWSNGPEIAGHDGKRAIALLEKHGIRAITTESAGVTLDVPGHQAKVARQLLAVAILEERLRILLFDEQGQVLNPDKLVAPSKK